MNCTTSEGQLHPTLQLIVGLYFLTLVHLAPADLRRGGVLHTAPQLQHPPAHQPGGDEQDSNLRTRIQVRGLVFVKVHVYLYVHLHVQLNAM